MANQFRSDGRPRKVIMPASRDRNSHPTSKGSTYALSRQMVSQFASDAGATACHDLKGRETGVVLTPCPRCIEIACDLVERTLFSGRDA